MENSTYNNSYDSDDVPCSNAVSIFFTTAMVLLSLAAVIGNILVFVAVYRTPSLRTSTNYYYVNMAASDFMSTMTTCLLYLTDEIITSRGSLIQGPLATIGCQVGLFMRNVSHSVSLLSLVLIAVDRYIATVFPIKASRLGKNVRGALLLSTWMISIGYCSPVMHYAGMADIGQETFCTLEMNASAIAIYYSFCLFVMIALLIAIVVLYSRIMRVLKRRLKPEYGTEGSSAEHKRNRHNHNVIKIFRSIVVAFIVCWFLLCIFLILKMILPELFMRDKCKLMLGFAYYVFPMLSTVINPIILFSFSSNFCNALKKLCSFSLKKSKVSCKKVVPDQVSERLPENTAFKILERNEVRNKNENIRLHELCFDDKL